MCRHIQAHHGAHGTREILGILALATKHGPAVVEDAAWAAVAIGVLTDRFIRKYVVHICGLLAENRFPLVGAPPQGMSR